MCALIISGADTTTLDAMTLFPVPPAPVPHNVSMPPTGWGTTPTAESLSNALEKYFGDLLLENNLAEMSTGVHIFKGTHYGAYIKFDKDKAPSTERKPAFTVGPMKFPKSIYIQTPIMGANIGTQSQWAKLEIVIVNFAWGLEHFVELFWASRNTRYIYNYFPLDDGSGKISSLKMPSPSNPNGGVLTNPSYRKYPTITPALMKRISMGMFGRAITDQDLAQPYWGLRIYQHPISNPDPYNNNNRYPLTGGFNITKSYLSHYTIGTMRILF